MSKYRLMEDNGLYKIEEYKKVGSFKRDGYISALVIDDKGHHFVEGK